jgi:hypothetical protein
MEAGEREIDFSAPAGEAAIQKVAAALRANNIAGNGSTAG